MKVSMIAKRIGLLRYPLILCGVLIASIFVAATVFASDVNSVIINYNGELIELTSTEGTVEQALLDAGITLTENDEINCSTDTMLSDIEVIEITEKDETILSIPGNLYAFPNVSYEAAADPVLLANRSGDDLIYEESYSEEQGAVVETSYEDVTWELDFETEYQADPEMLEGTSKVLREGSKGSQTVRYEIKKSDGELISKDIISSEVVEEPVSKLVSYGTKKVTTTSKGVVVAYKSVLNNFKATAYTACNVWGNATASGMYARRGVIAVDPSVIPMGTKVYVEGLNGASDYGYAIAGDTGGAINGNIIDLYMEDESTCRNWGVKRVNIYILEDQSVDVFSLR